MGTDTSVAIFECLLGCQRSFWKSSFLSIRRTSKGLPLQAKLGDGLAAILLARQFQFRLSEKAYEY